MTARGETVRRLVGHVRVDDGDADQFFTLVERLYLQPRRQLANPRIDELARYEPAGAPEEIDVDDRVEVWEDVGDEMKGLDPSHQDQSFVLSPLPVREEAVYWSIHVSCK